MKTSRTFININLDNAPAYWVELNESNLPEDYNDDDLQQFLEQKPNREYIMNNKIKFIVVSWNNNQFILHK